MPDHPTAAVLRLLDTALDLAKGLRADSPPGTAGAAAEPGPWQRQLRALQSTLLDARGEAEQLVQIAESRRQLTADRRARDLGSQP